MLVSQEANHYWRNVDLYRRHRDTPQVTLYTVVSGTNSYSTSASHAKKNHSKIGQPRYDSRTKQLCISHQRHQHLCVARPQRPIRYNPIHVDVNIVHHDVLDIEAFKNGVPVQQCRVCPRRWQIYLRLGSRKMSKSMYNVVNPDDIVEIRCRHPSPLRNVSRTPGAIQTLGYQRN